MYFSATLLYEFKQIFVADKDNPTAKLRYHEEGTTQRVLVQSETNELPEAGKNFR